MAELPFKKVFLIDDSEVDLFIQQRLLEAMGFSEQLITYKSAQDALDVFREGQDVPDLIFLDLNMPGTDGYSFLEALKAIPPETSGKAKIVVLTSSNSENDRARVFHYKNVVHFISKPLSESHVKNVREILATLG